MTASRHKFARTALFTGTLFVLTSNALGQSMYSNNFDYPICQKSVFKLVSRGGTLSQDGTVLHRHACETAPGETFCGVGTPLGKISFSLTPDGPFTPTLDYSAVVGNCGSGCVELVRYVKGLEDGETYMQDCPVGDPHGVRCNAFGPGIFRVYSVQSLAFDPQNSSLESWNGGKRIFPGKQTPDDTEMRRRVKIKANTSAQLPGETARPDLRQTAEVMFRSVDMDDPSSDDAPIDPEGDLGNDNRGTPKAGRLVGGTMFDIDANGQAETEFEVTMHPGDNFKVVAGCDQDYLTSIKGQGPLVVDADGADIEATGRAKGSDLLTVWRKLHYEIDKMGSIGGNVISGTVLSAKPGKGQDKGTILVKVDQLVDDPDRFQGGTMFIDGSVFDVVGNTKKQNKLVVKLPEFPGFIQIEGRPFTLVDDDDFNESDQPPAFLDGDDGEVVEELFSASALESAFASAFILPVREGNHENPNIPFVLNVKGTSEESQMSAWRGLTGSNDFWVSYVQIGYQGDLTEPDNRGDGDPDLEMPVSGVTVGSCKKGKSDDCSFTMTPGDITSAAEVPKGGFGSFIYVEVEKEGLGGVPNVRDLTVPHEIGHQFGLDEDGEGLMNIGGGVDSFSPNHLNLLRWRSTSPGQ